MGMFNDYCNKRKKYQKCLDGEYNVLSIKFHEISKIYKKVFKLKDTNLHLIGMASAARHIYDLFEVEVIFLPGWTKYTIILDPILFDMAKEDIEEYFLNQKLNAEEDRDSLIAARIATYKEELEKMPIDQLLYAKEV